MDPVASRPQQPAGIGRRRQRLSDQETERRMLDAALAMVNATGLTVSLDHLSFEDVIRDARVSRSTVYRRWPYKDLFFSDLLKELARAATPAAISSEETSLPAIRQVVLEHLDWLSSPDGRSELILELIRRVAIPEFETMHGSTEWRTYLALHATSLSVADDELRRGLQEALAGSERDFIGRIAAAWQRLVGLFGYRLRPELGATFEDFASMASADLRGHVILSMADPRIGTHQLHGRFFGTAQAADWSPPGLAVASIAQAFFEPDPEVTWDKARVAALLDALELEDTPGGRHPLEGPATIDPRVR
jgi:AcrR family transcriptional regulator